MAGGGPASWRTWLKALSDGYVVFDREDIYRKVQGPVVIRHAGDAVPSFVVPNLHGPGRAGHRHGQALLRRPGAPARHRAVGHAPATRPSRPPTSSPSVRLPLRRTPLYAEHVKLKGKVIPFAGWEMPVWYTAVSEEHAAVRKAAGLFDVAHMGTVEVAGPGATRFLDLVTTNYVPALKTGQSQYAYLLDPSGNVLDDILIYRREPERYMVVVNASNAEKDLAWLQGRERRPGGAGRRQPGRARRAARSTSAA